MNTTTHYSQKIHQNAQNAPNKAHLNNPTEKKRKSNGCEATKINRPKSGKTKRKHGPKGVRFVL